MAEKKCSKCGQVKPPSAFAKNYRVTSGIHDGLRTECRACFAAANRDRYRNNPESAAKAKANRKRQAAKRFTSAHHRELWRAARRRYRWRKGAVPRHIKLAQKAERDARAAAIRVERVARRRWLLIDGPDAEVQAYYDSIGQPWRNPRLNESEERRVRYNADPEYHAREQARLYAAKAERRQQIARVGDHLGITRERELREDAERCTYCGVDLGPHNWSLDHVVPLSKGGAHDEHNVVPACRSCNSSKQDGDTPRRLARTSQ